MRHSTDPDPARHVAQPVARALDGLIYGAVVSFAFSIATVLAALRAPDGLLHEIAHVALVGAMGLVLLARAISLLRRPGPAQPTAWDRARASHRWDAHLAEALTAAVPIAWLLGGAAILVQHLPELSAAAPVMGAWLPIVAVLWIGASFAWHDLCRDRIASALIESDRRYRQYWRELSGAR